MQCGYRRQLLRASSIALAGLLVLPGCSTIQGGDGPSTPIAGNSTQTSSATTTSSAVMSATPAGGGVAAGNLAKLSLRLSPVASGLDKPLFVTNAGDGSGRLFVVEQGGLVKVVRNGTMSARAFLDIRNRVSSGGERGLLGLAFSRDYAKNGRFYVNYTNRSGNTVVARFVAKDPGSDSPRLSGQQVVFSQPQPYANHNGGCIAFAPDGTLWVGMGDGGSEGDPGNRAQNPRTYLGKMVSLDVEGTSGRAKPKIVYRGLRNPWRFSFDRPTHTVWIGDVGGNRWEEIDVVRDNKRGLNFGWKKWEGDHTFPPGARRGRKGFTFPVLEYSHSKGEAITGGYVYRGKAFASMQGIYFYGDFIKGWLAGAAKDSRGKYRQRYLLNNPGVLPSSFGVDEDGEVYVCDYNGAVLRLEPK